MGNNRINLDGFGIFGIFTGLVGIGYAIYQTAKLSKTSAKLDMSIDEISRKTKVEVEQDIVNAAVEKAIQLKANKVADKAVSEVSDRINTTMSNKITEAIKDRYNNLSEQVTDKIAEHVSNLSEETLSSRVIPRVEAKLEKAGDEMLSRVESSVNQKARQALGKSIDLISGVTDLINNKAFGTNNNNNNQNRGFHISYD